VRFLLLPLFALACDRPEATLVCHNANCVEPVDPERDDTLPALRESLALEYEGRPAIDGIEIDSFWHGERGECVFAHDLNEDRTTPFTEAAAEIAGYFARPGPISYADRRFAVFLELKSHVGRSISERHSPAQRASHAACAWQAYAIIADAAVANGRDIEVIYGAFEPKLLAAVVAAAPAEVPVPYRLQAFLSYPRPFDLETRPISAYAGLPIEVISLPPQWIHDAQYEGIASSGFDILMGMNSATVETFAALQQYRPTYINTSEARLLRRWLEY
jgi:hypothetical protein